MHSHVQSQANVMTETFATFFAAIRFLPCVRHRVFKQERFDGETFVELSTSVKILSTNLSHHLQSQANFMTETFTAFLATKRFLSCVNFHVHSQVTVNRKTFATFFAAVRFHPCVSSHVQSQANVMTETSVTFATAKRFLPCVRSHVFNQV